MSDQDSRRNDEKQEAQATAELAALRQRLAELEDLVYEHGQMVESLRQSESRYRAMVEAQTDLIRQAQENQTTLERRNRELALLNRAVQAFMSTLDLEQVITTVLDEVRRLLGVVAGSLWLIDLETKELICRQATGYKSEIVRGWHLTEGAGIASWVVNHGQSLIVPDTRLDQRHFKGVDRQTQLEIRSILSVPLKVRRRVIGILQMVDSEVGRFKPTDLELLEPLAATAASAIENARLYEQARQDSQTKLVLLNEVNHRVKNNLAAIVGILYAERRHAGVKEEVVYQTILKDLINRVQGLATVHSMLSAAEWAPLPLSELTRRVIHSALQATPPGKQVSVSIPTSPVKVSPKQANHLALIINELTTNTIKYALANRDQARITIHISLEGGSEPETDLIVLEFRDDGPAYPEEVLRLASHNVGLVLIQTIARNDLGGDLTIANDHGAVAIVRFKKEANDDSGKRNAGFDR
jgi:two-component sensor histidine kinase